MSQNYFLNIISSRPFKYEQILLKGIHHVRTLNFEVGNFAFIETHLVERVAIMDMDNIFKKILVADSSFQSVANDNFQIHTTTNNNIIISIKVLEVTPDEFGWAKFISSAVAATTALWANLGHEG